jgi:hypothetical protein
MHNNSNDGVGMQSNITKKHIKAMSLKDNSHFNIRDQGTMSMKATFFNNEKIETKGN